MNKTMNQKAWWLVVPVLLLVAFGKVADRHVVGFGIGADTGRRETHAGIIKNGPGE